MTHCQSALGIILQIAVKKVVQIEISGGKIIYQSDDVAGHNDS